MSPYFGVAYYPEHWPEDHWSKDIRLMQEAGITVARMAEFAWSTLKPAAGEFDFDWLNRAIEKLATAGIVSVLGTPTATPPAWLVEKDPEILATDENGRKAQFGNRCHYCVNSSKFQVAAHRIVKAMGEYFGSIKNIIGWQLDNEFNRVCYCDNCRGLFHKFLARKYDHYVMSEDLDLASWDWYIGTGHHNYLTTGAIHDLTRGFKRQNFWLMETQPGNVNWSSINNSLIRGEARAMACHAVGPGADAVLYWQWRSALGGQEQYHGSIIDQSGQPSHFIQR